MSSRVSCPYCGYKEWVCIRGENSWNITRGLHAIQLRSNVELLKTRMQWVIVSLQHVILNSGKLFGDGWCLYKTKHAEIQMLIMLSKSTFWAVSRSSNRIARSVDISCPILLLSADLNVRPNITLSSVSRILSNMQSKLEINSNIEKALRLFQTHSSMQTTDLILK